MTEKIIVQLANPERYFTKCYHDFMDCNLLNGEEKIVFLALKRFLDVKTDNGNVFPTIETIQGMTGWGKHKVIKYIESLVKKGVVKKIRQGLSKPNIYILSDQADIWNCNDFKELGNAGNSEEVTTTVDNKDDNQVEKQEQDAIRLLESMGYTVSKEKVPDSDAQTKTTSEPSTQSSNQPNTTSDSPKSQAERYPLKRIRKYFDYDAMVSDNPYREEDIDSVMDILHTAMNTTKGTVRVAGEDKPTNVVIGKLMKLDKDSIIYAINKFSEQTERVRNPASYMLTVLYTAPEQFRLDINNQVRHNMAHWVDKRKKQNEYSYEGDE